MRIGIDVHFMRSSIVVDNNGIIAAVGPASEISEQFKSATFDKEIDATGIQCILKWDDQIGKCIIPGLVDAHTHVTMYLYLVRCSLSILAIV